jgi:hypothetical protein
MASAFWLMLKVAWRKSLRQPQLPEALARRFCRNYQLGPFLYVLVFGTAFISKWLTMGLCTALWIFWAIVARDDPLPESASDEARF